MRATILNQSLDKRTSLIFGGDYEVVGPDPALGQKLVADLSADFVLIHYHHRHEFQGGSNKGLWGSVARGKNIPYDWHELDRTISSAKEHFSLVALYPIGWAHMIPEHLGETILDVDPEVVSDWVCHVVERYWRQVDIFPIFYEMNAFDLFFRATHGQPYGADEKRHILECLVRSAEKVLEKCGEIALSKLIRATISNYRRVFSDSTLVQAKANGHYLNSYCAHMAAKALGYDEALLMDVNGVLAEASASNLFVVRNGTIYTPLLTSALAGITRDTIIALCREEGYPVIESCISVKEVMSSDEVFLTGTACEVSPIISIDDISVGTGQVGPLTRTLSSRYQEVVRNNHYAHSRHSSSNEFKQAERFFSSTVV